MEQNINAKKNFLFINLFDISPDSYGYIKYNVYSIGAFDKSRDNRIYNKYELSLQNISVEK